MTPSDTPPNLEAAPQGSFIDAIVEIARVEALFEQTMRAFRRL
jgi:hypothetical protein